ncbi:MAG: family 16 glycosylhydrolase [Frankiales bacterium]|nr:family 16 glycosylhydrolase [Frankiales bacterium]
MPKGDLPGWTQIFADDFSKDAALGSFLSAYGTRWTAYPSPWKDTSGNGTYDPARTLSASNGLMDIWVHTVNGVHYVSAPMPKLPKMTYGRYSVRFQADSTPGYKVAWLLWPDSDSWPADGEIDFPEGDLSSTISAYAHYASSSGGQDAFELSTTFSGWHTSTVEWKPGKVVFYLDGKVIGTSTKLVPSKPMHWVLQTETRLSGGAPSNSASGHVRVDWVTAYSYTP